jgi:hypothetical protein
MKNCCAAGLPNAFVAVTAKGPLALKTFVVTGGPALAAAGEEISVIIRIHPVSEPPLAQIAGTFGLRGLGPRLGKSRKQEGRQDRDDRNNNQQFDQRERADATGRF